MTSSPSRVRSTWPVAVRALANCCAKRLWTSPGFRCARVARFLLLTPALAGDFGHVGNRLRFDVLLIRGRLAALGSALLLAVGRLKQRELCIVGACSQHRRERHSPHGLGQQEALGGVALHRLHRAQIVDGLHPVRAHLGAEAMSKVYDSLAEAVLDLARCAPSDETAIDLDLDKRKVVEARQRG